MSARTVHDPFAGKYVQMSDKLTDRLRGKYACGPHLPNGNPEFGWRQFQAPPIQHEAAARIERLEEALRNAYCFIDENVHFCGDHHNPPELADSFSYEAAPLLGSIQIVLGQNHADIVNGRVDGSSPNANQNI